MSESIHGVVAPPGPWTPYNERGLEISGKLFNSLAEHVVATYPSAFAEAARQRIEAAADHETAATLLGETLVETASKAGQQHNLEHNRLLGKLEEIRLAVGRIILLPNFNERPREGALRLNNGDEVLFENTWRSAGRDHYLLQLQTIGRIIDHNSRLEENYSMKLIDIKKKPSICLPASTTISDIDYSRKEFVSDSQGGEHLMQFIRAHQKEQAGDSRDHYNWETCQLASDNNLFAAFQELQARSSDHWPEEMLAWLVSAACIRRLESSMHGQQLYRIHLTQQAPNPIEETEHLFYHYLRSDNGLPKEVKSDSSIKVLWSPDKLPDNLQIELWQKDQKKAGSSHAELLGLDLGRRTQINIDARGQTEIRSHQFRSNPKPFDQVHR